MVIWPEMLGSAEFEHGLDIPRLAADYQAFTDLHKPHSVNSVNSSRNALEQMAN